MAEMPIETLRGAILSKARYCVGHYKALSTYVCCGRILNGGYQCAECLRKDFWRPCAECNGSFCINPNRDAQQFCLSNPFAVYLAYFGGKLVKVWCGI